MSQITSILSALPASRLDRGSGASEESIAEVESVNGIELPADVRDALRFSDGFGIGSKGTNMTIYGTDELMYHSQEPHIEEWLPGMFVLGTDGEGSLYYADPHNKIARGAFAVYLVPMSDMGIDGSRLIGATLTDAVKAIVAGENLYDRLTIQKEREYPTDFVSLLTSSDRITRAKGASKKAIDKWENEEVIKIPDDLRAALGVSNGFTVHSEPVSLQLFSTDQMTKAREEARFRSAIPGMVILGTDGDRGVFFADMLDQLGRGDYAVYLVPTSDLGTASSRYVGPTFSDAVKSVLDGEDLYARPAHGPTNT